MQAEADGSDGQPSRDDLFRELGRVVFEFGQLDEALHDALYLALGGREETRILTAGLRLPELVARFEAIYASFVDPISPARETGVHQLCADLRRLNEDRNRELHSVWGFYAESGNPIRTQHRLRRGGMALRVEAVKLAELAQLARRMSDAADKVWDVALDFDRQRQRTDRSVLLAHGEQ